MNLLSYIAKNLILIHEGSTFVAKAKASLMLGVSVSPIAYFIEKVTHWTLINETYVVYVFGAIMVDHIIGSILHIIKKDFCLKKNIFGFLIKVGLVIAVGFLFEGINEIVKEESFVKNYMVIVLRLSVFLFPAGSAFMNSSDITKGVFPPIGWITKIKSFQKNLDINQFKDVNNASNN